MIAGMQLSNTLGDNNYVHVSTFGNNTNLLYYNVTVENNNYLKFVCLTTVIYEPYVNEYYHKTIIEK